MQCNPITIASGFTDLRPEQNLEENSCRNAAGDIAGRPPPPTKRAAHGRTSPPPSRKQVRDGRDLRAPIMAHSRTVHFATVREAAAHSRPPCAASAHDIARGGTAIRGRARGRSDGFDTNGISSSRRPKQVRRKGRRRVATAARVGGVDRRGGEEEVAGAME
ncbi:hypothetical protein F511_38632 [Dorcoceras hygrometricum]|uniref:Uncharacterized protein n=1 Tax=Dorcoceras hygrometricum TaxID=472368 RepID=A0A2Z7AY54_9LAMI|nr:hypothetical protein F511_38632 [Dorcoceras hygrometricum]